MKNLRPLLYLYSHAFCIVLLSIIIFMGVSEDLLFFKSDHLSLLHFFSGFAFLFSLPVFLLGLGLDRFFRRPHLGAALSSILLSLLILGFYVFLADYLAKAGPPSWKAVYSDHFTWVFLLGILFSVAANFALPDARDTKQNIEKLAALATVGGILVFLSLTIFVRLPANATPSNKHVVLIVMDRLSTKYLSAYHKDASATPGFDEVARQSLMFTNMHTNRAYTHGYFHILYNGKKHRRTDATHNLMTILERNSVMTKWVGCHGNGLPDTHSVDYPGLRGLLLNQYSYWLPALLGVPFHIYWYDGRFGQGKAITSRDEWLTEKMAALPGISFFDDLAFLEVERARSFNKPSFTILYIDESAGLKPSPPWCNDESESCKIEKQIDKRDYAYADTEEEKSWVAEQEAKYIARVKVATDALARFYKRFEAAGWGDDTLLMVTADHGSIYEKNRIWYTFHSEEEVARVPFLLNANHKTGVDSRLVESIDISRTILDFLGIEDQLSPDALSLLEPKKKQFTTTLTEGAVVRHEFFLNVYQDDYKFIYNIFDLGNIQHKVTRVQNYFDTVPSSLNITPKFDVTEIIKSYGCERGCMQ